MTIQNKKWLIGVAVVVIVIIAFILGRGLFVADPAMDPVIEEVGTEVVLYYTSACPFCQSVKEYIAVNGITGITQKEISPNQGAEQELLNKLNQCGEDITQGVRIPILWAANECFVGEEAVMSYIQNLHPRSE